MVQVHVARHPRWLSNSWLVIDEATSAGLLIDAGGPLDELFERAEGVEVRHILLTHHHHDHIREAGRAAQRWGAEVLAHASERDGIEACTGTLEEGDVVASGGLRARAMHIPGHTCGQLAFVVDGVGVFTGDTLFKGSIGGNRGPGHTSFEDLRSSLIDRLMSLPPEMAVYPGHMEPTTIGAELASNPFLQMMRGERPLGDEPCEAFGQAARLRLEAADYDGGTKAWVRFEASGEEAVVPGSRVQRGTGGMV